VSEVPLKKLDKKGSLRILHYLYETQYTESRQKFMNDLRDMGVGGSAFTSSLKTLKDLGLVLESTMEDGKTIMNYLSKKGVTVGALIYEILPLLKESPQ